MRNIFSLLLLISFSISAMAQSGQNDPKAKKLLDKLKAEYDGYTSMSVDFDLVMELPGQEVENQKGSVIQQGSMYKLELSDRAIYANDEYLVLHIKKNNEAQINDLEMDEETNMLSPKDMLSLYESGEYEYAIFAEPVVDGKKVIQIEFKPLDRDSEFSKMSLFIDKKSKKMSHMKVFSKDGSRYTLKINDIVPNKKYDVSVFTFDESKFPDVHIEDLRID